MPRDRATQTVDYWQESADRLAAVVARGTGRAARCVPWRLSGYTRMARSWRAVKACQAAATAPSIQSGDDSGAVAAEPMMMRLSMLASCARRAAVVPDA